MSLLLLVPTNDKEREALVWGLGQLTNYPHRKTTGDTDPLQVLFNLGHRRTAIMRAANDLFEMAYSYNLHSDLSILQKDILRVCVENSSWVNAYITGDVTAHDPAQAEMARETLRSLSLKLDEIGIEINYIPED